MSPAVKTPVAARILEVSHTRLHGLIRNEKIAPPRKDSSGDYVWSAEDLAAARSALIKSGPRKAVPS